MRLGYGFEYGGLGLKLEYLPIKHRYDYLAVWEYDTFNAGFNFVLK